MFSTRDWYCIIIQCKRNNEYCMIEINDEVSFFNRGFIKIYHQQKKTTDGGTCELVINEMNET